jgi:hypothetical protein
MPISRLRLPLTRTSTRAARPDHFHSDRAVTERERHRATALRVTARSDARDGHREPRVSRRWSPGSCDEADQRLRLGIAVDHRDAQPIKVHKHQIAAARARDVGPGSESPPHPHSNRYNASAHSGIGGCQPFLRQAEEEQTVR